jgi:hypothetical protein
MASSSAGALHEGDPARKTHQCAVALCEYAQHLLSLQTSLEIEAWGGVRTWLLAAKKVIVCRHCEASEASDEARIQGFLSAVADNLDHHIVGQQCKDAKRALCHDELRMALNVRFSRPTETKICALSDLLFPQDNHSEKFSNGAHVGQTIDWLVDELLAGKTKLDNASMALNVVRYHGKYWSLNNRHLVAICRYSHRCGVHASNVAVRVYVYPLTFDMRMHGSQQNVLNKFVGSFSTTSDGCSIRSLQPTRTQSPRVTCICSDTGRSMSTQCVPVMPLGMTPMEQWLGNDQHSAAPATRGHNKIQARSSQQSTEDEHKQAFDIQACLRVQVRPGIYFQEKGNDYFKAHDQGTVFSVVDGKAYIVWDRSGNTSWADLPVFDAQYLRLEMKAMQISLDFPPRYELGTGSRHCSVCNSLCHNRGCKENNEVVCLKCWPGYLELIHSSVTLHTNHEIAPQQPSRNYNKIDKGGVDQNSQDGSPITPFVGVVLTAKLPYAAVGGGYMTVEAGDTIQLKCHREYEGHYYGQRHGSDCEGWFPITVVLGSETQALLDWLSC